MYSRRLRLGFGSLLLLLIPGVPGWAHTERYTVPAASVRASSVDDAFSAYHAALSGAADGLLGASAQSPLGSQSRGEVVIARRPDVSAFHVFAQQYWGGQDQNVRRATERVALLRPMLDPILHEEGVPVDVVALVLVESGGRPTALSPKGALGLWQFMPETARRYGLVVTPVLDERTDVVKSTRAAAHYLRALYSRFGDWELAFAAYNTGEGAVQRAMDHGAHDFETLSHGRRLPMETRNYVPAVLSAVQLLGGALPRHARPVRGTHEARVLYAESASSNVPRLP